MDESSSFEAQRKSLVDCRRGHVDFEPMCKVGEEPSDLGDKLWVDAIYPPLAVNGTVVH